MHRPHAHAPSSAHLRAATTALRSITGLLPGRGRRGQGAPVSSHARVPTERSERYGKQLCDHAAWKASRAEWTPPDGVIEFPGSTGVCRVSAESDCLRLSIEAATPADLARLQQIIGGNIERFAAREGLTVTWADGPDPAFKSFI
ncbi:hypothetical protein EDD99_0892 [Streptomyces sp. 846.5]|nr:DUF2218 domain-containing protein [Streptomyces sp. 846.5]TDU02497.1 hypothetical protein EDD99_0892 [Streptomyces sp. 846.5]